MIKIRKSENRGSTSLSWLESKHTFSFGNYQDNQYRGFESLLVINDDIVKPGKGFSTHSHNNMEIISYVLHGSLQHKDSIGNGSIILPGDVQRMSAGTGVTHSEYNNSANDPVHFLQIWFIPDKNNLLPSYEQKNFSIEQKRGKFCLVASKDGHYDSVSIIQNVNISVALINKAEEVTYDISKKRSLWVHIAQGTVNMNNISLKEGDGAAIYDEKVITFTKGIDSEIIVFDMKPI